MLIQDQERQGPTRPPPSSHQRVQPREDDLSLIPERNEFAMEVSGSHGEPESPSTRGVTIATDAMDSVSHSGDLEKPSHSLRRCLEIYDTGGGEMKPAPPRSRSLALYTDPGLVNQPSGMRLAQSMALSVAEADLSSNLWGGQISRSIFRKALDGWVISPSPILRFPGTNHSTTRHLDLFGRP